MIYNMNRDEIKNKVIQQVGAEVWKQVMSSIWVQTCNIISEPVMDEVNHGLNKVDSQVDMLVKRQVRLKVRS